MGLTQKGAYFMNRRLFALVAGLAAIFTVAAAPADAQPRRGHYERVGTLECVSCA